MKNILNKSSQTFQLESTYVHLEDGGDAMGIPVSPTFWQELMTGRYESVEAKRVALSPGWLLMVHPFQETMKAWEMHPLGDEILYLLSGEMDLIFEEDRKERHLELKAGSTCIVPKGIWHRQIVLSPGKLLGVTYGKNTQHKQL